MEFRKHFGYDVKAASDEARTYHDPEAQSVTVQSMAEDADLNVIMKRFGVTGKMPENPRIPQFADFTGVTDFRSALHSVMAAQEGFMELPASVRAQFENNPQKLLEFCADDRNIEAARKLGLLKEVSDGGVRSGGSAAAGAGVGGAVAASGGAAAGGAAASGGSSSGSSASG